MTTRQSTGRHAVPELLVVEGVRRRYGSLSAVDGVDLRVAPGERHALIGPNGAGKTTLLDLIAGANRPDEGRILFAGRDITRLGPARRARLGIGRTHQRPSVWPSLTVRENVDVAARFSRTAMEWLDRLGLAGFAAMPAGRLSHGQCRQLEIAMALAGQPRLLLLDEPAAGLSHEAVRHLDAMLAELPRTLSILIIEHHLDLVHSVADAVTVLRDGRVESSGAPTGAVS